MVCLASGSLAFNASRAPGTYVLRNERFSRYYAYISKTGFLDVATRRRDAQAFTLAASDKAHRSGLPVLLSPEKSKGSVLGLTAGPTTLEYAARALGIALDVIDVMAGKAPTAVIAPFEVCEPASISEKIMDQAGDHLGTVLRRAPMESPPDSSVVMISAIHCPERFVKVPHGRWNTVAHLGDPGPAGYWHITPKLPDEIWDLIPPYNGEMAVQV